MSVFILRQNLVSSINGIPAKQVAVKMEELSCMYEVFSSVNTPMCAEPSNSK